MNNTKLLLTALIAATPLLQLNAQESDAVTRPGPSSSGLFAYVDYYNYIGAGSMGELLSAEATYLQATNLITFNDDPMFTHGYQSEFTTQTSRRPSGSITGGTVGYTWGTPSDDRFYVQFGYRSGTQDTLLGYTRLVGQITGIIYQNYLNGDNSPVTFTSNYKYYYQYKQDTDEYRINFSYSPKSINYVTFGVEYVYGHYKATIIHYIDGHKSFIHLYQNGIYWYDFNNNNTHDEGKEEVFNQVNTRDYENVPQYFYGFQQKTHDLLLHATLKTPVYKILSTSFGTLMILPRIDIGAGYSIRSGAIKPGYWYATPTTSQTVITKTAKASLDMDKAVFESTATLGLYYTMGSTSITLDAGYRYKTDLFCKNYGSEVQGFYSRLGVNYSW